MSAYRVVVTREGHNWLADVPGLPGAHTFARNLETLEQYVREVVVLAADLPDGAEAGVQLDWDYRTGSVTQDRALARLRSDRRELEAKRQAVEQDTADSVLALIRSGYSVRDAAALTGLSRARVQQLVDAAKGPRRAKAVGLGRSTVKPAAPTTGRFVRCDPTRAPAAAKTTRDAATGKASAGTSGRTRQSDH